MNWFRSSRRDRARINHGRRGEARLEPRWRRDERVSVSVEAGGRSRRDQGREAKPAWRARSVVIGLNRPRSRGPDPPRPSRPGRFAGSPPKWKQGRTSPNTLARSKAWAPQAWSAESGPHCLWGDHSHRSAQNSDDPGASNPPEPIGPARRCRVPRARLAPRERSIAEL